MTTPELLLEISAPLLESPIWDDRTRLVRFADVLSGVIRSYSPDTGTFSETPLGTERVSAVGLCQSGALVVSRTRHVERFDAETGESLGLVGHLDHTDEIVGNRFNDGRVGPDGCFWVGTRDGRRDNGAVSDGTGHLWQVAPDGRMTAKVSEVVTSNGLAFGAGGTVMYHSDSHLGQLTAWDFDSGNGIVGGHRWQLRLTDTDGRPDGGCCDTDGNYWSAGVSAGCVNTYAPDGRLLDRIDLPIPQPTMVCLADGWLYITSRAADGHPAALHRLSVRAQGLPEYRFAD